MSELMLMFADREKVDVPLAYYPDGMPLVKYFPKRAPVAMLLRPRSLLGFSSGLFWVDALRERGFPAPSLVLPFVPGARQDRLNREGDYLFTAKSVARMINARGFPRVTVLDPHSDVSAGLIDRCKVVHARECINVPPGKYAAVVSPDAGAEKRATAVGLKLGVPTLRAWKTRDIQTGDVKGFGIEAHGLPAGSLVLVVDDICDGGATFTGLADAIDDVGLKAHLWTTHGIYSRGTAELLKRYGHIYCSDSIDSNLNDGAIVVKVCESLLEKELE